MTSIRLTVLTLLVITSGELTCSEVDTVFESLSYLRGNEIPDDLLELCGRDAARLDGRGFGITSSILQLIYSIIGKTGHSAKSLELARQMNKLQEEIPEYVPFPCRTNNTRSKVRPSRVTRVRPGDIDVIAAIGDSLVAANGAVSTNVFQVLIANRGVSWAIGGQETWRQYLTLPNILKEFNPNLVGYSTGDSLYSANRERSQLNAAEPAARSRDLVSMAQTLIDRIYAHPRINVQKDWKMVTIFIGAMDFCFDMCFRENPHDILEEHRKHLTETLTNLKENLPRTIVNVVLQINLGQILPKFSGLPWLCTRLYKAYECPCLVDERFRNQTSNFRSIMSEWQEIETEVVRSPQFQNRNDFAVVVQPFLVDTEFPTVKTADGVKTDIRYLSHDCFHPSQLGHAKAANALWNNIMEPIGKKSTNWDAAFMKLRCPTEEKPYIPVR
ncbi:UNVERIFIED_CONTAM: hypothetical protein PYX00_009344 [Menopon gallinae]|uniref:Phospholipase B1, membrane-associated n=1 Tax=Menopon gallinae TaxID=328185 RepID=A0AAW2HB47_9NEOP